MQQPPPPNEDKFQALNRLVSQQTPASTANNNPNNEARQLYSPTPKEMAYAIYILEQCFPSSMQLYNQNRNSISITGQDAVAFLTTSGIHRLILRILWTVVDPQNFGTLTEIAQFHTILRLVALTQAGHVEPELLSVGTLPPPKPTPVQVVWKILNQNATTVVPLAKFDAVAMPNPQQLQQIYMLQQRAAQQQPQVQSQPQATGMAAFDALAGGATQDQPLPALAPATAPAAGAAMPNLNLPSPSKITGAVSNAFGGFLKSAASALNQQSGGLQPVQPEKTQLGLGPPVVSTGEFDPTDDFGGFTGPLGAVAGAGMQQPQAQAQQPSPQMQPPAQSPMGMAALDALGPATDAPLPSLGNIAGSGVAGVTVPPAAAAAAPGAGVADFGGFSGAAPQPVPAAAAAAAANTASGSNFDISGFAAGATPAQAATTAAATAATAPTEVDDDDVFGGFSAAPPTSAGGIPTMVDVPSPQGMAAFDSISVVTTDATLHGLGAAPQQQQQQAALGVGSGFVAQPTMAAIPPPQGMAALDSLGAATDAPLPALGATIADIPPAAAAPTQSAQAPTATAIGDDFGGFSGAAPVPPAAAAGGTDAGVPVSPKGFAALDSLGPIENAPLPSLGAMSGEGAQQPGVSAGAAAACAAGGSDSFGGFEGAQQQQSTTTGMAALDALGSATDAPLPALGGGAPAPTTEDEFGGFSNAPAAAASAATGMGALDALGPAENAPLPGQQPASQPDEFGGFTEAGAAQPSQPAEATGLGALDALGPAENAPLPILGGGGGFGLPAAQAQPTAATATDDDFGGFTDAPVAAAAAQDPPAAATQDEFGGFTNAPPQQQHMPPSNDAPGMSAFDALAGVQDAPLPGLGMGQPQSDRGLEASTSTQNPVIQQSMSFPGTATGAADTAVTGMSAFDAIGTSENAPLPSLGTNSAATSASSGDMDEILDNLEGPTGGEANNPNDMSFGSFTQADPTGKRRSMNGSLRRRSSRSLISPETVPKDLMPPMPGEQYVAKVRQNSMRKLPELDLDDVDDVDDQEHEDPFAGLDPAPGNVPVELNEAVSLGPAAETMPKDLQPHSPGERYVPHSKNAAATPGGLQTLEEPNHGVEDDEFGGFTEAPAKFPSVPNVDPASEPNPFSESMPQDMMPHAPGEHYVPHGAQASRTPGGLPTVGEGDVAKPMSFVDMSELNPPTGLTRKETPLPQDLKPHKPGEHYVPHTAPGGLATVGEAFGELVQVEDAKLPGLGANVEEEDDDFGDFTNASAGAQSMPPPVQLSRQATPAAKDLDPLTKKASSAPLGSTTIQEGDEDQEDEDDFGDFASSSAVGFPGQMEIAPPTQMKRQETPRPQDLRPDPPTSEHRNRPDPPGQFNQGQMGLGSVAETIEEDFGSFTQVGSSSGAQAFAPPTVLSRQATPAAKDLELLPRKANVNNNETIFEEETEEETGFGAFTSGSSDAMPPPAQLSRQATPAAKDLDQLKQKGASGGALEGMAIQEGEEEEEGDDFGGFESAGMPGQLDIVAPPQMKRKETPRPQDIKPNVPGSTGVSSQPGLAAIGESQEAIAEGGVDKSDDSTATPDPFAAFDTLAAPQATLAPLPAHGTGAPNEPNAAPPLQVRSEHGQPPSLEESKSLDVFSLQNRPKGISRTTSAPESVSRLGSRSTASLLDEEDEDEQSSAFRDVRSDRSKSPMIPDKIGFSLSTPVISEDEADEAEPGGGMDQSAISDFGDFGDFTGGKEVPAPSQLARQATPAAKDLDPLTKKASAGVVESVTIMEEDNEDNEDEFGVFSGPAAGASVMPPPAQLSRQATPAAKDLDPLTKKATAGAVAGAAIQEGNEEEEEDEFGDFGGFTDATRAGTGSLAPPTQLSRQATPAAKDLDPLTKKASAGAVAGAAIQEGDEEADEDEFGDFGGFAEATAGGSSLPPPTQLSRQATPAAKDLDPLTKKASAGAVAGTAIQEGNEEEEEDEFGDFGGFASAGGAVAPPPTQLSRQATPAAKDLDPLTKKASAGAVAVAGAAIQEGNEEEEEDEFGDFGGFETGGAALPPPTQLSRQATPAAKDLDPLTKKASAGASAGPAIQEGDEEEEDDEFGDFGGFSSAGDAAVPPPTQLSRQATPAAKDLDPLTKKASDGAITGAAIEEGDEEEEEGGDFGDFGGFEQASEPTKTAGDDDDFGGFTAAAAPAPASDDDFGDFSSFSAAPAPAPDTPASTTSWDAFQDASGNDTNPTREKMASLFKQLPPQFLETFDYDNTLNDTAGKPDSQKRIDRSLQVLALLASTSSQKLASTYWAQVMDVARDELSLGNRLLEEASGLSSQEQKATQKPLETMVAGMGEYVRATRSIVASVGDMLLLDVSTQFNESTIGSSWGSVALVKKAWEVEKLWHGLLEKATALDISPSTRLETIVEIRTKCLSRSPSTKICNLSLQPLSDEDRQTTKATVDWGGKPFMACSANFLANKCPFYAIND